MIAAGIALLPERFPRSLETIQSLLPQVDAVLLSLNGFSSIPEALNHPKIEVRYMGRNLGDIGKFHKWEGDYISCDDDLVYSETYVSDFKAHEKKYPETILTHHGNTLKAPLDNYFRAKDEDAKSIRCLQRNSEFQELTIPGTGVSYYPANLYPSIYEFIIENNEWNCQDMVVGAWLKKRGLKAIGLPHSSSYFQYNSPEWTIWQDSLKEREKQTIKFNRILS